MKLVHEQRWQQVWAITNNEYTQILNTQQPLGNDGPTVPWKPAGLERYGFAIHIAVDEPDHDAAWVLLPNLLITPAPGYLDEVRGLRR